jgi:hypothetical protein
LSSTSSSRPPEPPFAAGLCVPLLLASLMLVAGCASSSTGDHLPTAMGGLPAGAPSRPATTGAYPAVNDVPPPRETTVLTSEEQKKLQDELAAARERAAGAVNAPANSSGGARNP